MNSDHRVGFDPVSVSLGMLIMNVQCNNALFA